MIEDFEVCETGNAIEADLCIVGGGAAGITIARELAESQLSVCLLESGGFEEDPRIQSLYAGENVGRRYYPLEACRLRYFGGTTNHWNGQCAPLSEADFEDRPWVPHSGWPLTRAELDPFYRRAESVCELGDYVTDEKLLELLELEKRELNRDLLRSFFFRYSPPVRFGVTYRSVLQQASNIRTLLNATVVNIRTNETGARVEQVDIKSLSGKTGHVRAKAFVLACGGIENARVLLLSRDTNPNGVGNDKDLVGRFFMEHPKMSPGVLVSNDPIPLLERYLRHWHDGVQYRSAFRTGDETQRRERVLGASAVLEYTAPADSGTMAAIAIGRSLSDGEMPDELGRKIWRMLADLDEVVPNAYRYIVHGKEPIAEPERLYFRSMSEQAPNPESRVTLGDEEDALGLARARLDWRLTDQDKRTVEVMTRCLGIEFGRLGMGRVQLDESLTGESDEWQPHGSFHHMGTTRMSENPNHGVVDSACRVHTTQNLHVAGSSVFATSGHVNPTLTLVALALRLADHLRGISAE